MAKLKKSKITFCEGCFGTRLQADGETPCPCVSDEDLRGDNKRLKRALEAQAAENAELRASRDGYAKQDAARAAECDRLRAEYLNASKDALDFMARALAAETALATAREDALEEWREIEQHVQPRIADGYTAIRLSKPGFWFVKGPGPATAFSAPPLSQGGQADG